MIIMVIIIFIYTRNKARFDIILIKRATSATRGEHAMFRHYPRSLLLVIISLPFLSPLSRYAMSLPNVENVVYIYIYIYIYIYVYMYIYIYFYIYI